LHTTEVDGLDPDFRVDFRSDAGSMQLRWTFDTVLRSPAGRDVAELGLSLIQSFDFLAPDKTHPILSDELIREFAEKTAIVSVMPFVREAVHTMTTRLGLPAVTLGLMKPGSSGPQSFSVRGGAS